MSLFYAAHDNQRCERSSLLRVDSLELEARLIKLTAGRYRDLFSNGAKAPRGDDDWEILIRAPVAKQYENYVLDRLCGVVGSAFLVVGWSHSQPYIVVNATESLLVLVHTAPGDGPWWIFSRDVDATTIRLDLPQEWKAEVLNRSQTMKREVTDVSGFLIADWPQA
jgi:hypothetical protein